MDPTPTDTPTEPATLRGCRNDGDVPERAIYVACLASYNNGRLFGEWIDAAQDADTEARERALYRVRGTSSRTGAVMWVRQDGTPASHESEGGRWSLADARREIDRYAAGLVRVTGRCAWLLEPIEIPADAAARKVG